MPLLQRLSSALGVRTQDTNTAAAQACLQDPKLLNGIAGGLSGPNAALVGDCAEVMKKVAETLPLLVLPYIGRLAPLLGHKTTRVRWEATHAIALVAPYAPQSIVPLLRTLTRLLNADGSTVVRDYAIDALCGYGATDDEAAGLVFPPLQQALASWDGKHRARILAGFARLAPAAPSLAPQLRAIADAHANDGKPAVRQSAKTLWQALSLS
jgi:hypothetical protein